MLKILAMIFMTVDHLAAFLPHKFAPYYLVMRSLGRLAFPVFAYELALGYRRSRNPERYFLRLFGLAILTELTLSFLQRLTGVRRYSDIMITLCLSFLLITAFDLLLRSSRDLLCTLRPLPAENATSPRSPLPLPLFTVRLPFFRFSLPAPLALLISLGLLTLVGAATLLLEPDYFIYGVLLPFLFWLMQEKLPFPSDILCAENLLLAAKSVALYALAMLGLFLFHFRLLSPAFNRESSVIQVYSCFAALLFPLAKVGKRPSKAFRAFCYFYYPLHLALIFLLFKYWK